VLDQQVHHLFMIMMMVVVIVMLVMMMVMKKSSGFKCSMHLLVHHITSLTCWSEVVGPL